MGGRLEAGEKDRPPEEERGVIAQGLTFDTGVLIALERRRQRAWSILREAMARKVPITVPSPVLTEWWRGPTEARAHVRSSLRIEPLSAALAELAGEVLATVPGATAIDAIVMASAASRGDVVYTGDFDDLEQLRAFFPGVRVLAI
jgi:predicted nucleic acid-binding protein